MAAVTPCRSIRFESIPPHAAVSTGAAPCPPAPPSAASPPAVSSAAAKSAGSYTTERSREQDGHRATSSPARSSSWDGREAVLCAAGVRRRSPSPPSERDPGSALGAGARQRNGEQVAARTGVRVRLELFVPVHVLDINLVVRGHRADGKTRRGGDGRLRRRSRPLGPAPSVERGESHSTERWEARPPLFSVSGGVEHLLALGGGRPRMGWRSTSTC